MKDKSQNVIYTPENYSLDELMEMYSAGSRMALCPTNILQNPALASITITSPNGGENWQVGTRHYIDWTTSGTTGANVKIDLFKNLVYQGTITSSTANDGRFTDGSTGWLVPSNVGTGTDYKIKIMSTSNSNIYDFSNGNFTISSGSSNSITITSPNGGENWQVGTINPIKWTSSGSPGTLVNIKLYKGGVFDTTITSSTSNDGYYGWTVPAGQALGTDYKIKVTSVEYPTISDSSNNNFTISAAGTANIVATGTTLDKTSCQEPCAITANITWKNTGTASGTFTPKVKVDSVLYSPYPSQSLAVGVSVTKSFSITGLTIGSHVICPDPNP